MAYANIGSVRISADADKDCGSIYLKDVTEYPIYTAKTRALLGYALFWSIDDFVNVLGYDIGNGEDWYADSDENSAFQIRVYAANLWDNGDTYDGTTYRKIVWHSIGFYMQTTNGAVTSEPGTVAGGSDWQLLALTETNPLGGTIDDGDDLYAVWEEGFLTQGQDEGISNLYITTNCPLFTLEKQSCHNWRVNDNSGSTITVGSVILKKYEGTVLDDELSFSSNIADIDLGNYVGGDDGVFIVEVWGQLASESEDTLKAELVIYDFCDAWTCYMELVRWNMCKCADPCDKEDCEEQYDITERRYDMNSIFGMLGTIERYVYRDRWEYIGVLSIEDDRDTLISRIGQMVEKLSIIVNRCGKCTTDATNDLTC